jgi:DNA-binding transcriptional MerR regulator
MLKTAGIVCKELGIPYHRLDYLLRTQNVLDPQTTSSGWRVFSEEDISIIKKAISSGEPDETRIYSNSNQEA